MVMRHDGCLSQRELTGAVAGGSMCEGCQRNNGVALLLDGGASGWVGC